jgi:acetyl esterase/lipase
LARAKDAAADRRLLFIHGGSYVAGAIDTHHKMYASLATAVGARALLMAGRAPEADHAIAGLTGWPNLAA